MKKLWQIKDDYAKKHNAHDWISFIDNQVHWWIDIQMDEVCKIYAKECVKASLEKASENAMPCTGTDEGGDYFSVDKESINNPENIILL